MIFSYGSQVCENVLHFKRALPYSVPQLDSVCDQLADWWVGNLKTFVPVTVTLVRIEAFALDLAESPGFVKSDAPLPSTGTAVSPQLPNNVSLAVTLRTVNRGRSFRGRIFHVGMREDQVVGNTVDPAVVAGLTTSYTNLVGVGITTADQLVVLTRFSNGAPRAFGFGTNVISISINDVVDSQRRRLPGRGA